MYMTGPARIDHVSTKMSIFSYLLHHNLIACYTNTTKSLSLLENVVGFLLQFMEIEYSLGTEDISKNTTQCNLHSHG